MTTTLRVQATGTCDASHVTTNGSPNCALASAIVADNENAEKYSETNEEGRIILETVSLHRLQGRSPPAYENSKHDFQKLSWQGLTGCLICEAIALGALSLPKAFATLGMIWGILATVFFGLLSTYTAIIVGETQLHNPTLRDYPAIGRRLFGQAGYVVFATMFILLLMLVTGSHVLTGVIALKALSSGSICAIYLGLAAAAILFAFSLPRTFHNMAFLAYTDFASIAIAVLVTIIVSGKESMTKPGGIAMTEWYMILPKTLQPDFPEGILAITNIVLAYAFAQSLPSFMAELHRPQDYRKAIWSLGVFQVVFYVLTGTLIYAFKGTYVASPALLSIASTMQKVVFGLAMPVIFISGSINGQTASKFIYEVIYPPCSPHRFMKTRKGLLSWISICFLVTVFGFLSAETIPSFSTFLGLLSALFSACFSFTFPAMMYFRIVRDQATRSENTWIRRVESAANIAIFFLGCFLMVAGSAACIISLTREFKRGVSRPFSC